MNVECPDCKETREVGKSNLWLIRTGKLSGRCKNCAMSIAATLRWSKVARKPLYPRVWVSCINCGERRYIGKSGASRGTGICYKCSRQKEQFLNQNVFCPMCGEERKLSRSMIKRIKSGELVGSYNAQGLVIRACRRCNTIARFIPKGVIGTEDYIAIRRLVKTLDSKIKEVSK